jgi:glycine betaine/choline ABC-type transport system substrate-binding protein
MGIFTYFTKPGWISESAKPLETGHKVVRIGTKNFTEQLILGEMMAQVIEAKTDLNVERRFNLGGTMICHGALVNGEIDLYAEYTGTGLTAILKHAVITDPEKALYYVTKAYHERFDLQWLKPFGFNNTYAITIRSSDAAQNGWNTISDLKASANDLLAGFTAEFAERPDGYPGLRQTYNLQFGDVRDFDPALMYEAIRNNEVDVICAFATDGRIAAYNLKPLEDDRNFFPPYHAAPVIREEILKAHPGLENALSLFGGLIDDATMQRLNFEVDGKKRETAKVVEEFLRAKGIL